MPPPNRPTLYSLQLAELDAIQLPDVVEWAEAFFRDVHFRIFVHGNVSEAGAVRLVDTTVMGCLLAPLAGAALLPGV